MATRKTKIVTSPAEYPPPADKLLEMVHLLACIEDNDRHAQRLHEDIFFFDTSQEIVRTMKVAQENGEKVTLINLKTQMLEAGAPYDIANDAEDCLLTARSHPQHGHKVERELTSLYRRRLLFDTLFDASIRVRDLGEDPDRLAHQVTLAVEAFHASQKSKTVINAQQAAAELLPELTSDKPFEMGMNTGILKLDEDIGGFRKGMVCVFIAQSHFGKTSYMLMTALLNAQKGKNVLIVTGEDTKEMLIRGLLVQNSKLNRREVERNGKNRVPELTEAVTTLPSNIFIFEAFGLTPAQIASRIQGMITEHNIDFVLCDYLKVLSQRSSKDEERHQLNDAYEHLAYTMRTSNVAGIIFSQITESDTARDLKLLVRGSKDVAHRADTVIVGLKDRDDNRRLNLAKAKAAFVQAGSQANYFPQSDENRMVFVPEEDHYHFDEMPDFEEY